MNNNKAYEKSYLKYKLKYFKLKEYIKNCKKGGGLVIEECENVGFHNAFGTCWNISIQMMMFFGDSTRDYVQNIIDNLNKKNISSKKIIENSLKKLKQILP